MCDALRAHPDPEIRDWVREKGDARGGRELRRIWERTAEADTPLAGFTEDDLALEFSRRHSDELRYLAVSGKWYRYHDGVWFAEETLEAFDLARDVCRVAATDPRAEKVAREVRKAKTVAAIITLARADRRHATEHDEWNANPKLIAERD